MNVVFTQSVVQNDNSTRVYSEHGEESAFTATFAESLHLTTKMSQYRFCGYLDSNG
jgi:hypothetical protein